MKIKCIRYQATLHKGRAGMAAAAADSRARPTRRPRSTFPGTRRLRPRLWGMRTATESRGRIHRCHTETIQHSNLK